MIIETRLPQNSPQAKIRASQEYELLGYSERLGKNPAGHIGAEIHLSRLQKQYRRDNYLRIATDTFETLVKPLGGQIFALASGDTVFVTKDTVSTEIANAVNRLRTLFQEDPLTQYTNDQDHGDFCTWYRMGVDYPKFHAEVRRLYETFERQQLMLDQDRAAAERKRQPLGPMHVAKLEQSLSQADLTNLVRTQTVCTIMGATSPGGVKEGIKAVYREAFVSIADLQALLTPDIDLLGQAALFRYLTLALDRRIIAWACRENIGMGHPFSLNMNVATVLSPDFAKLDRVVAGHLRGRVVIELQLSDIFADMGAFLFARDWLQEHGYRVCIDGLTHLTFSLVDRARLGCDLVKLCWTGGDEMSAKHLPELKAQVAQTGQARTILCRCDSERAIAYGHEAGIIMYQGRLIEQILHAKVPG